MITGYASEPQFAAHVAAVLESLPDEERGPLMIHPGLAGRRFGIPTTVHTTMHRRFAGPALVAASGDLRMARNLGASGIALLEHGAGQSYGGRRISEHHPSYAGGRRRDADLFLHPGPHPAARDRAAYPAARVEIVGSPLLDRLPSREYSRDGSRPVVAFAFHFDATVVPEARSGFPWFRSELATLARRERTFDLLGHGHPRIIGRLTPWYARMGIPATPELDDVFRRADVLVGDNTSALYAFAATGRPVVVLNPPWYSRDVDHGLRFWSAATVGIQVDERAELEAAILAALDDAPELAAARERAVDEVYAYRTGGAARAAAVLLDWLDTPTHRASSPATRRPELAETAP